MPIPDNSFPFDTTQTGSWATFGGYNKDTGVLTVNVDLSNQEDLEVKNRGDFCQPTTYCAWDSSNYTCGCKFVGVCKNGSSCQKGGGCSDGSTCTNATGCTDDEVCALATKELDCPVAGCYGFRITMPASFEAVQQASLPPAPTTFSDPYFTGVTFEGGAEPGNCAYNPIPKQGDCAPTPTQPAVRLGAAQPFDPNLATEPLRLPNP